MFLTILTLLSALSISAVAIFYSIAGLAAIFAGAAIPIMIMGSVLEVGKLVTASWLYQNWKNSPRFLKYYLTIAVLILMFITSMGIFGFLSKAHVEQTAPSTLIEGKIVQLDDQIVRENAKIERWTVELDRLNTGTNVRVDNLVDNEQDKLNLIYQRIDKEIADITAIANRSIETQKQRIDQAKERADRDIKQIQERMKGAFGKAKFDKEIDQIRQNEVAVAASAQKEIIRIQTQLNEDITKIKEKYQSQIDVLTSNIAQLTGEASDKTEDIDGKVEKLETQIQSSFVVIDGLNEEKFTLQGQIKEIEVEVGPIKYIAEFVYGTQADKNMLEEAVRWVIIIIIFVFDPLAVLLLIAANYNLKQRYGKSLEDFADQKFKFKDDAGVEPDQYWKERYEDMQEQLERFNILKEQEDAGSLKQDVNEDSKYNQDISVSYDIGEVQDSQKAQEERFKLREEQEKQALEEYSRKARLEDSLDDIYATQIKDDLTESDDNTEQDDSTESKKKD